MNFLLFFIVTNWSAEVTTAAFTMGTTLRSEPSSTTLSAGANSGYTALSEFAFAAAELADCGWREEL